MSCNRIRQYNSRLIVSGNVAELFYFEKPVVKGFETKKRGRANSLYTTEEIKANNRKKIASRACATVRRFANANPKLNKFFTLTFAENITDIEFANYEFDKFVKRLKSRDKKFQFIKVIEFQKRGAIHFHLLCNLSYIAQSELQTIWGNGIVYIERIDNIDNIGAYITKYMSKDNIDERLIGKKCYSMSKGLIKPTEITEEAIIDVILENMSVKRTYTAEFENEYFGKIKYTQYVCYISPIKAFNYFLKKQKRLFLVAG